jgi:DNA polymerase-3 subunit alpha (Gram-positive type)
MEEKYTERVELNLHTYMSGFISVIRPREAIEAAVQMGHRAVGITDFESVQSFLEVATCHQKYRDKIKVIYGIRMFANGANVTILAKNQAGLKALYQVVSTGEITPEQRENLLVASAYWDGELTDAYFAKEEPHRIMEIISKYDYIELTPPYCSGYPKDINQKLYALGKSLGKPVVAVSDCNYIDSKDRLCKEVLNCFRDVPMSPIQFHTTAEMLQEFSGLGAEAAYEVIVTNPNKIADSIEFVDPLAVEIPDFVLPEAFEEVAQACEENLKALYGERPAQEIRERLDKELSLLGKNATLY